MPGRLRNIHPGEVLAEEFMKPLGVSQNRLVRAIGVPPRRINEVLGFRPDYIEYQLAHAVCDPNGSAYNRTAHLPERRKMMQEWADYLDKLKAGGESHSNPSKCVIRDPKVGISFEKDGCNAELNSESVLYYRIFIKLSEGYLPVKASQFSFGFKSSLEKTIRAIKLN